MNSRINLRQWGQTKVLSVPYGRRRFLPAMVVLFFSLCLFCSDASALLEINVSGTSNVYGIDEVGDLSVDGNDFGWVIAIADDYDAYSLYSSGGDIAIVGTFGSGGTIEAIAGEEHAYGLYSPNGSITTDAINGIINAVAGDWKAVGLFTEDANITTGDIGGTINVVAGGSSAFGLRSDCDFGSITTGAISGTINVVAGGDRAYGFRSDGSISTGDINGTITATAAQDRAYGLSGYDSITIGDINGTITAIAGQDSAYGLYSDDGFITTGAINGSIIADANNGSYAYGMYAYEDIIVDGNIGSTANIAATAGDDVAGLYSSNGSIYVGDIDGTISAKATGGLGDTAYGLYADVNLTTGAINGSITAEETYGSGAYALYAWSDLVVDGNVGSSAVISATAGQDYAYGLFSGWSTLTTGDIEGTIDANAGGNYARGLFSWDSLTTGVIDGNITVSAGGIEAAGLYSANGSIDTNDINGNITATAAGDWAYGLRTHDGSITTGVIDGNIIATAGGGIARGLGAWGDITTGAINGNITADANGSNASALYSWSAVTVDGNIASTANISATTRNGSDAYALYAGSGGSDLTINGDIDGTITADANTSYAYALYAYDDIDINGDIGSSAHISATAGLDNAAGLHSVNGSIYTYDIDGMISADANGSNAYALYSDGDIMIYGNIGSNALISATAGQDNAYAFFSGGSININGDIDGEIYADANNFARGLYSMGLSTIETGAINGTISVEASDYSAYALYSNSDIVVGDIGSGALISATAGTEDAYGLYSAGGSITTGAINGEIYADANNFAFGLNSSSSVTIHTGPINGTISATAGDFEAYALASYGDIVIDGDIGSSALISATAGGDNAYAFASAVGSIDINGDIDGMISADANNNAYGMYSSGGTTITTGAINGTIEAEAYDSDAYALYSNGDIEVGDIGSSALISATAGGDNAYGFSSMGIETGAINGTISADANNFAYGLNAMDIETGVINGSITATATNGSYAYGLNAMDIETGVINGSITATAGQDFAYGLSAMVIETGAINGTVSADANNYAVALSAMGIETGAINGTITATAEQDYAYGLSAIDILTGAIDGTITADVNGSDAYAMYADGDIIVDGDIGTNAYISATAGGSGVTGLYSTNGSITTGAINGTIIATAGDSDAYGLDSGGYDSILTGNINGTITATAGTDSAGGLVSNGSVTTGNIDGTITATAGTNKALGLYSYDGSITTGAISGTIDVNAGGDYAYGILSYDAMDVTVDGGTISAIANGGTNVAAIQSGRIEVGLSTQDADDELEIVAGSAVIGDINLARTTDDDLLTLSGVDTDSTTFDYDIMNIETIDITGGHWYVNGTVSDSANGITMYGGILSGTGTLGSLNIIDGTLAPGSSIGTTTVDGDLTLGPDSTFEVEVDDTNSADLVIVTGAADVDGTIRGVAIGDITHSFSATVIDANTGLSGEFATVDGNTAFLFFSVDYNLIDYNVILNVEHIPDLATYSLTGNQSALGNLFNELEGSGGDMDDVIDEIRNLPDGDAVNDAYNQIMPQDRLGLPDIIRKLMNQQNDNIMGRMDDVRRGRQYVMSGNNRYLLASADNSVALPSQTDKWMPFIKGIGIWGDRDSESDVAGYDFSIYGAVAGMDKLVSDDMLFGFGLGGSTANVDYSQSGTDADIDSFLCSLYGSYFTDDWHIDWTASYSHSWYDSKRRIAFGAIDRQAKSDHEGDAYSIAAEFGKDLGGPTMIFEPVAGLGYTYVRQSSYTEKGADALNLKVGSDSTDGFYTKLGVRAAKEIHPESNADVVIVPKVSLFWVHDFVDRVRVGSTFVDGGSFSTRGHDPVRDLFNVGAALNVYYNNNTRFFVDYVWQSSSEFSSNMAQVGVQWSF